jgi:Fe-S cluster assembly protein SufD
MNIAVMKSKVEQGLAEQFHQLAPQLPGSTAVQSARLAAFGRFSALGVPHRRIEEWKYTDLRSMMKEALPLALAADAAASVADLIVALGPLAHVEAARIVFVNGHYRADLSDIDGIDGIEVGSLSAALKAAAGDSAAALTSASADDCDATVALNTALMTDGAVIKVADGVTVAKPVLTVFMRAGKTAQLTSVRNTIAVGAGAEATVIEAHVTVPGAIAEGQTNALSEVHVGAGARFAHLKLAVDGGKSVHLSNWNITLGRDASYQGFQYTAGQALARNQSRVVYAGEGGRMDLSGAFLARGTEHVDTTFVIDHAVPGCESRELFKGVLDDRGRGIFQGKVIVRPDAQKTDGKQMAQALMLSPDAEFDSKPELEIYADDVVCGHGTTSAELDADLLFYCMSRGIPQAEARALLIESFIGEAIDKVGHDGVREAIMAHATDWLRHGCG